MESLIGSQYPLHLLGSFRKIIQGLINQSVGKLTTCPDVEIRFDKTRIIQTSYVYGLIPGRPELLPNTVEPHLGQNSLVMVFPLSD